MKWTMAATDWQHFRDEVHANWTMLTVGHLDGIAGNRVGLAARIRETYGLSSDEAERQIRSFEARNEQPRPVSSR